MGHGSGYVPVVSLCGDSIDNGFGAATLAGWEEIVFKAAKADGNPIFFVGAAAPNGGVSSGMAVDPWNDAVTGSFVGVAVTAGYKPDIILAGGGTNNVTFPQDAPTTLAAISGALDTWYGAIRFKSWGRILFHNILLRAVGQGWNPVITAVNAGLQALVNSKSYASQVTIVDVASALNTTTDLNADGLHPTDGGYTKMGNVIYPALKPLILSVKAASGVG